MFVGMILPKGGQHIPVYRLDANGKPMAATLTPVYPPVVALDRSALKYAGIYAILGTPTFTVTPGRSGLLPSRERGNCRTK